MIIYYYCMHAFSPLHNSDSQIGYIISHSLFKCFPFFSFCTCFFSLLLYTCVTFCFCLSRFVFFVDVVVVVVGFSSSSSS